MEVTFSKSPCFIKANELQFPTNIDTLRRNTENRCFLQSALSVVGANSHCSWQSWWNYNGDDVQTSFDYCSDKGSSFDIYVNAITHSNRSNAKENHDESH